jgi:hypothetical protein
MNDGMVRRGEKHWKHCVTVQLGLTLLRSPLRQDESLGKKEVVLATSGRAGGGNCRGGADEKAVLHVSCRDIHL